MYNETTLECCCDRCGHLWTARSRDKPATCAKCTSKLWDCGTRKFDYIICRVCGTDEETGLEKFCLLEEIVNPSVITDDVFLLTAEDYKYLKNGRRPIGSAIVMIGDFEINSQNRTIKINDMKVCYCHETAYRNYVSTVSLLYRKDTARYTGTYNGRQHKQAENTTEQ